MWTEWEGTIPDVRYWISQQDRERIEQTERFLRKVRIYLRTVQDTEKVRRWAIRKAASIAIRNDSLRGYVERQAVKYDYWRTCSSDHFVDDLKSTIEYAIWDPVEYMDATGRRWPEQKYVC